MNYIINKNEEALQQLINNPHIAILVVDKQRNNLFTNDRLCEMFGYDEQTLLTTNAEIFHVNHTTFQEFANLAFNSVLNGKPLELDYQFKHKDGTLFWAHISGSPIKDHEEVLWILVDITQRVKVQEEITKLSERMDLALLGNKDGIFDWNLKNNSIYFSPQWKEMLGFLDDELANDLDVWEKKVHPDDRDRTYKEIQKHIDNKTTYMNNIHRLKHKDGHWVWINSRAKAIFDENNKAVRMIGTHTDITKQKSIEIALQEKTDNFQKLLDSTMEAIAISDEDGSIIEVNQTCVELLKEENKEAFIGKSILKYVPDYEHQKLTEALKVSYASPQKYTLIKSDGTTFPTLGSGSDMIMNGKKVRISIILDLTNIAKKDRYLQAVIDGVAEPIMVIADDYTVKQMNKATKDSLSNYQIADPKNPKCYEISHRRSTPCDGDEHPCPLKGVLESKKHLSVVHNHKQENGEDVFVELSATPLFDDENNCIGIIESAHNITKHLQAQQTLKDQKNELFHQAHHDALTGLPNRVLFNDRLEQSIKKAKRNNTKTAVLFIDLDHFKEINDSLGHNIGDEVLKKVTKRIKETVRAEDTVARLGGDEFTVIIEDFSNIQNLSSLTNNILKSLSKVIECEDTPLYISSSIGISIYPDDGGSSSNLLKYADSAMYKAKAEGRNNYQFYDVTMTELAFERVVMEASLREALDHKDIVVYYQPQMNAKTNQLVGMEALVRWQHVTLGLVQPSKFIPLAESSGLIVKLDREMMRIAMQQLSSWYSKGLNPGVLAMNLSVTQLEQKDFIPYLKELLEKTKCQTQWIELEVTESQMMKNPEKAIKVLKQINDLGIKLAIDDFGTGYSSLTYLKRFPISKLKIDQAFIKNLPHDEEDIAISQAVIALAKSLKLDVLAEGVETQEQKEFLIQNACENIQGYLYSRPIPPDEYEIFLSNTIPLE